MKFYFSLAIEAGVIEFQIPLYLQICYVDPSYNKYTYYFLTRVCCMLENQEFWLKDFGLLTLFKDIKVRCSQVILPVLGFDTEVTQIHASKFLYRKNIGCHQSFCRSSKNSSNINLIDFNF